MLYKEVSDNEFVPWNGEAIGGVLHPATIETFWSYEELKAIGLFKPLPADPIPDGKVVTGTSVARVDGVVRYVHDLEDAPEPTGEDVNAERARRIEAGRSFNVTGYGPVPLTGRDGDQVSLMGLLIKAQGARALGVTAPVITLRDGVNVNHQLTPDQAIELISAGTAWIESVMKVSWDMKDRVGDFEDGVPYDFTDDQYWPT